MDRRIYQHITQAKAQGKKQFAVLIDPDQLNLRALDETIKLAIESHVDMFFVGGSLILQDEMDQVLTYIQSQCSIPTVLFPGSGYQINDKADAILFLSLISGRNADALIGKHVEAAPLLMRSNLEVISTGYMLVDGGAQTTASYISNSMPIPNDKPNIAVCTAMAGQLLGLQTLYMDAGSGAKQAISTEMIAAVSKHTQVPLIIGGGIRSAEKAYANVQAGADIIVVGNAIEKDPQLIKEIAAAIHSYSPKQVSA